MTADLATIMANLAASPLVWVRANAGQLLVGALIGLFVVAVFGPGVLW